MKKQIDILGQRYEIITQDAVYLDGRECYGRIDYESRKIYIENGRGFVKTYNTIAHEVCHAIMYNTGMSYLFTPEQREAICDVSAIVADIMREYK